MPAGPDRANRRKDRNHADTRFLQICRRGASARFVIDNRIVFDPCDRRGPRRRFAGLDRQRSGSGVRRERGARVPRHSLRRSPSRAIALDAAAAPASWEKSPDATAFANTCPQSFELGVYAGLPSTTEDCLYLNVFTTNIGRDRDRSERDDHGGRGKDPVLLWIHGGGWFDGESNDYDASQLALGGPSGPTVVVTINYRLGLSGFLAHPALEAEGHPFADYGLMDQQAALRWVQQNIAAFGGDPDNVTIGGQSAGAVSAAANVASPAAAGLFHRAIIES